MKVHVSVNDLQKKLSFVSHAISARSQLPILLHILLETKEDRLFLSGTDLEIGIETNMKASVEQSGGLAVPAKLFVDLINSLPADTVLLELKETTLSVITKKTKAHLQILSKDEFPVLYEEKGIQIASLEQELLKKNVIKVVFASSIDTTRPSLSGVMIRKGEKGFDLVATDGYRLSYQKAVGETGSSDAWEKEIIIPSRVIRESLLLNPSEKTEICISKKNNQVLFFQNETVLVGRLIEAQFPPFEKIIPSDYSTKVFFDREELLKAVKACSIFARDAGNIIAFSIKHDKIVIFAHTPSMGENTVEVESRIEGEEKDIAFNAKYLVDLLSTMDEDAMMLEMTGPLNPGVFRLENNPSYLHLIMPIRTQN